MGVHRFDFGSGIGLPGKRLLEQAGRSDGCRSLGSAPPWTLVSLRGNEAGRQADCAVWGGIQTRGS